jgi:tripartite-type tricarboxylate transporter receptor subunit TctC
MAETPMYRLAKRLIAPLFLSLGLGAAVAAQDWPTQTVRVVVPFGPGSTPDIVAHLVAEGMQQKYPGSTFLVENKPGASRNPRKDIAPIAQLVTQPSVLVVTAELGISSVAELVSLLKKNPGKYNFASIGNGSLSHLAMEAIALKAGAQLVHVPYASSPQAVTAVIRNDAQMACLPANR